MPWVLLSIEATFNDKLSAESSSPCPLLSIWLARIWLSTPLIRPWRLSISFWTLTFWCVWEETIPLWLFNWVAWIDCFSPETIFPSWFINVVLEICCSPRLSTFPFWLSKRPVLIIALLPLWIKPLRLTMFWLESVTFSSEAITPSVESIRLVSNWSAFPLNSVPLLLFTLFASISMRPLVLIPPSWLFNVLVWIVKSSLPRCVQCPPLLSSSDWDVLIVSALNSLPCVESNPDDERESPFVA